MANDLICAELKGSYDLSCVRTLNKKYFQEIVVINFNDIDRTASTLNVDDTACDFTVSMKLKAGKKGVMIKLPESSGQIKGFYAKSTSTLGYPQYLHQVQFLMAGITKDIKCAMDKLDRGRYVVATQVPSGEVEIYGWENGLTTNDYTYDITEGGGGSPLILQSKDTEQESLIPLLYKSTNPGSENADFNNQFSQVTPST